MQNALSTKKAWVAPKLTTFGAVEQLTMNQQQTLSGGALGIIDCMIDPPSS